MEREVLLKESEYRKLKADSQFLHALEDAGVDSWLGYEEVIKLMEKESNGS